MNLHGPAAAQFAKTAAELGSADPALDRHERRARCRKRCELVEAIRQSCGLEMDVLIG